MSSLRITLADHRLNAFLELGQTEEGPLRVVTEAYSHIRRVPSSTDMDVLLDLLDDEGDILDDKIIASELAEQMLGQTIDHARRNSIRRLRRFEKRWSVGAESSKEAK